MSRPRAIAPVFICRSTPMLASVDDAERSHCSPEAYDGAYEDLISRARTPDPGDEEIRAFESELQQALADPGQLPGDELFDAVDYGDGSDEAFLRRPWHDLYGDQPYSGGLPDPAPAGRADPGTPGAGASQHRAMDAAYHEDLAVRLYGLLIGLEDRLDRKDARQLHHFIEVGEYGLVPGGNRRRARSGQDASHRPETQRHAGPDRHDETGPQHQRRPCRRAVRIGAAMLRCTQPQAGPAGERRGRRRTGRPGLRGPGRAGLRRPPTDRGHADALGAYGGGQRLRWFTPRAGTRPPSPGSTQCSMPVRKDDVVDL